MQTIFLDGTDYENARALHLSLQRLLCLPPHYGMNADALFDCLSERKAPVHVWVYRHGTGDAESALQKCLFVFEDLGGHVTWL